MNHKTAKAVWQAYKPVYILAFKDAADSTADKMVKGTKKASTHDYVEEEEFHLLATYMCLYARMLDIFR